jgi:hypothetical protein
MVVSRFFNRNRLGSGRLSEEGVGVVASGARRRQRGARRDRTLAQRFQSGYHPSLPAAAIILSRSIAEQSGRRAGRQGLLCRCGADVTGTGTVDALGLGVWVRFASSGKGLRSGQYPVHPSNWCTPYTQLWLTISKVSNKNLIKSLRMDSTYI